jgi:hypothetical protein
MILFISIKNRKEMSKMYNSVLKARMEPVGEDTCPKCEKKRTVYNNDTAHCFHCNSDFDIGMKRYTNNKR